ncbi:MAG: hypothetical protein CBD47_05065 [Synechococcus sp. TMED187]|nr:MAG: hypothetical protein CBD47_05065 [Synechococcus sp. TMED187]
MSRVLAVAKQLCFGLGHVAEHLDGHPSLLHLLGERPSRRAWPCPAPDESVDVDDGAPCPVLVLQGEQRDRRKQAAVVH